ncbi:MAG: Mth938-like domain-containing protein [Candidatus Micrarchaeia archaeon]
MEIPDSTKRYLEMKGIRLIEAKTGEAVKLYNSLSEKEKVAAALHLTC